MNKIEMISIPKTTYESSLALKRELVEALKWARCRVGDVTFDSDCKYCKDKKDLIARAEASHG